MSRPSPSLREWWIAVGVSAAIVALTSLPYLYGFASEPSGYHFTGLLINPYDGNSYLAKMEIGRRGGWLFHLPFTAEPGTGVPLYFLYIFLGHAAAWVGAPSILIFHMARALAGLVLLLTLFAFVARFFEMPGARWAAWLVIALGSCFGWLAVPFGGFTSDLWVAEAIVFLSIFANPHFPLSIALTLALYLLLIPGFSPPRINWRQALGIVLAATATAHLQPFASVTIGGVTTVTYAAHYYLKRDAVKRDHVARFVV
ncbi:MAG: hypothetical protein HY023_12390, partial [Chloroflexi bacterium]|nr:hypothetical protein [Chloroflexota bacterium]